MKLAEQQFSQVYADVDAIVRGMSRRPQCDVDDVVDAVSVTILSRLGKKDALEKPLSNYVRATALREARKEFQKLDQSRHRELDGSESSLAVLSEDPLEEVEVQSLLMVAINALPPEERRAIDGFFQLGCACVKYSGYYHLKNKGITRLQTIFRKRGLL